MSIKTIIAYVCDKCGKEVFDPNLMLKVFKITNANNSNTILDNEQHICKKCLFVEIEKSEKIKNSNIENQEKVQDEIKESIEYIEDENLDIELLSKKEFEENIVEGNIKDDEIEEGNIKDEEIEEGNIEDEDIKEDIKSDSVSFDFKPEGKYLVLYEIQSEEIESAFAVSHGYSDCEILRENYGGSLIGLFGSFGKYYINELPEGTENKEVDVINKIIFDVPNIIKKRIDCFGDFGFITDEYFNNEENENQENQDDLSQNEIQPEEPLSEPNVFDDGQLEEEKKQIVNLNDLFSKFSDDDF